MVSLQLSIGLVKNQSGQVFKDSEGALFLTTRGNMVGQLAPRLHKILQCQADLQEKKSQYQTSKITDELMNFILSKDADRDWIPSIYCDLYLEEEMSRNCNKLAHRELKHVSSELTKLFEFSVSVVRLYDNTIVLRLGQPKTKGKRS